MKKVSRVEEYIASGGDWKESLALLRELCTSTALEETILDLPSEKRTGFSAWKGPFQ